MNNIIIKPKSIIKSEILNKEFLFTPSRYKYIEIKNSRQQTPLSLHLLDLKSLKKWDPFSNQYKIE